MVTIHGAPGGPEFVPLFQNHDEKTAEFVVTAEVYFANKWHLFPEEHYYGGKVLWTVQPKAKFSGVLGLPAVLREWKVELLASGAWLRLKTSLSDGEYVAWRWSFGRGVWIYEVDKKMIPK